MSDKNNDMALGIAIGGGGGLCLFVLYNLFSSMSENREQLLLMREREIESELQRNEWQQNEPKVTTDPSFRIGGKRTLRKKSRKSKKSTAKMRWKKKRTRRLRRKRRKMRTRAK